MSTHPHSKTSYELCLKEGRFDAMVWMILNFYHVQPTESFTDREVKDCLFRAGKIPHDDMNMVRPKISKLVGEGFLIEVDEVLDRGTQRKVRRVRFLTATPDQKKPEEQKTFL